MDRSPPGSSVYSILQARILEWVAIPFSRGSFQPSHQAPLYAEQEYNTVLLMMPQKQNKTGQEEACGTCNKVNTRHLNFGFRMHSLPAHRVASSEGLHCNLSPGCVPGPITEP